MNIFYLDRKPNTAARYHCDKHVVKMVLESAQLLCVAQRAMGESDDTLYRASHVNHPQAIWARQSLNHYSWLYALFCALSDEYTRRYGKCHKSDQRLRERLRRPPRGLELNGFVDPPQAMPQEYKSVDCVSAYREYYRGDKRRFARWTTRHVPHWF